MHTTDVEKELIVEPIENPVPQRVTKPAQEDQKERETVKRSA